MCDLALRAKINLATWSLFIKALPASKYRTLKLALLKTPSRNWTAFWSLPSSQSSIRNWKNRSLNKHKKWRFRLKLLKNHRFHCSINNLNSHKFRYSVNHLHRHKFLYSDSKPQSQKLTQCKQKSKHRKQLRWKKFQSLQIHSWNPAKLAPILSSAMLLRNRPTFQLRFLAWNSL